MKSIAHVGMDVHKGTTTLSILPEGESEPIDECTVETTRQALLKYLGRWSQIFELRCTYEAGGSGYVPQRWLEQAGIVCGVIAPSKTPRAPGDRVRNDRRDARLLARQGRAGALTAVQAPTPQQEAVRSVVRLREARLRDLVAAKHRVLKFMRQRGHVYAQGEHWTQRHWRWLRELSFGDPDAWTAAEYLAEVEYRSDRLAEADRKVAELAATPQYREPVGKLCCFRGIDVLTAMVLITETLDFHRFPSAPQYMGYWGLGSREDRSSEYGGRGAITKAGSARARRALVEAAWHYQHAPAVTASLQRRQAGQPAAVIAHTWKAQKRLHRKFWRVTRARGSTRTAVVAVARELAGFIWAVMTQY
jgi:transposase